MAWLFPYLDSQGPRNTIAQLARYHWARVEQVVAGASLAPQVWEINPSGTCNIHCAFCLYANATTTFMDPDHFCGLVDQAKDLGAGAIIVAGDGEPLLHPQIDRMLHHIRRSGLDLMVFTNGTPIGRTIKAEALADYATMIVAGCYGGTRERYAEVTGSPLFGRMVDNFTRLCAARDAADDPPVILGGWVAEGGRHDDVPDVMRLGQRIGFDWMYLRSDLTGASYTCESQVRQMADAFQWAWDTDWDRPDFLYTRMLFDRPLSFDLAERPSSVALLWPGSSMFPPDMKWWSWNDLLYVGPSAQVRVTNRTDLSPFDLGDSRRSSLRDYVGDRQPERLIASGGANVGQITDRKALSNVFLDELSRLSPQERTALRNRLLDRFPAPAGSYQSRFFV